MPSPKLFVSYRRSRLETVRPAVDALRAAGIECFFDLEDIDPLADFPQRIREGIDGAHALLAWWSVDYGESAICLAEFRRGWQHARRSSSDIGRRVWVLNPEARGDHIFAGELIAKNFLVPPAASATDAWVLSIRQRLDALVPEGPLADERRRQAATARRNVPRASTEFTGRGASLLRMHSKLFPPQLDSSGASPGVQLFGMGGVGKSEVAAMYADTFAAAYPGGIFWLNLSSFEPGATLDEAGAQRAWHGAVESVLADDPDLQRRLMRDAAGRPLEPRSARALISQWLPGATPDQTDPAPYLWIVDNVPSMSPLDGRERILEFWRAPTAVGRTLLTTRDSRSMAGFVAEPLEVLDDIEALRLLSRYRAIGIDERGAAEALAREVGCHTLALTLLGERLRESDGYPAALDRLQATGRLDRLEQVAQLLRPELGERARSVVATFELSIAPLAPAAKQLLALAALCVPGRPIPQPLLGTAFGEARSDAFAVAMTSLLRASLLTRRHGEHAVEIHPLVADVAADLSKADTEAQRGRLVDALIVPLPAVVDVRKHRLLEDYVVHACQLVSSAIRTMAEASLLGLNRPGFQGGSNS